MSRAHATWAPRSKREREFFRGTGCDLVSRLPQTTSRLLLVASTMLASQVACDSGTDPEPAPIVSERGGLTQASPANPSDMALGAAWLDSGALHFEFSAPDFEPVAAWRGAEATMEYDEVTGLWTGSLPVPQLLGALGQDGPTGLLEGARREVPLQLGTPPNTHELRIWLLVRDGEILVLEHNDYVAMQEDLATQAGITPEFAAAQLPPQVSPDTTVRIVSVVEGNTQE